MTGKKGADVNVVSQTTYVFRVLHRTDQPLDDIEDALEEADTGHAVGNVISQYTHQIPDAAVPGELIALGNDGEFFDDDLQGEER